MQTQRTELNFEGQNLFVGIDVHLKSWTVSILTDHLMQKTFTQPASAKVLSNYLNRNFPGGVYNSVYEAGFSGFWSHYMLKEMGINNIVTNPADVSTIQKEHLQKDDRLYPQLRSGEPPGQRNGGLSEGVGQQIAFACKTDHTLDLQKRLLGDQVYRLQTVWHLVHAEGYFLA